ncbi:unnamed protein product [Ectocarpus fasciculatus]
MAHNTGDTPEASTESQGSGRPETQQDSLQPAATSNMTPAPRSTTAETAISDQATTPVSPANVGSQSAALMSGEGTASSTAVPGTTARAEDDGARSTPASSEGEGVGKSNGGGRKRGWTFPVWLGWGKKPVDDQPAESNAGSTSAGVRQESPPSSASVEPATGMDGGGAAVSPAGADTGAGSSGGDVGVGGEAGQGEPQAENSTIDSEMKDTEAPSRPTGQDRRGRQFDRSPQRGPAAEHQCREVGGRDGWRWRSRVSYWR